MLFSPDGDAKVIPAKTLYLSFENDRASVIRPRLEKMGANLDNIIAPDIKDLCGLTLGDTSLEDVIREHSISLVVFDPVQSFIDRGVDFHNASQIRRLLDNLAVIASGTGCSILLLCHPNKKSSDPNPLNRIMGSSDFRNQARSIMLTGHDPESKNQKSFILGHMKLSVGEEGLGIRFHVTNIDGAVIDDFCDVSLEKIFQIMQSKRGKTASKKQQARDLLANLFSTSQHVPLEWVERAAEQADASMQTVYRVKKEMGIQHFSDGFSANKKTFWVAPGADIEAVKVKVSR